MSNKSNTQLRKRTQQQGAVVPEKKKRSGRSRRANNGLQTSPAVKLSHCAMAYATALIDPFNAGLKEMLPCIPDELETSSFKFCTFNRGSFSIGTGNVGYVVFNPRNAFNDLGSLSVTNNAYPGDGTSIGVNVTTGISQITNSRSPFNSSAAVDVRCVGAGLRCRYVGTELNRGGLLRCISYPDPTDSVNGKSMFVMESQQECSIHQVDRRWKTIAYRPNVKSTFSSATVTMVNGANMAIIATGTPQNDFEFEVISYYEAVSNGSFSVPAVSKSDSDIVGVSIVRDFTSSLSPGDAGGNLMDTFLGYLKSGASLAMSSIIPGSGEVFRAIVG